MEALFKNTSLFNLVVFILVISFTVPMNGQVHNKEELVYVKIEIKGMACPFCSFGMEKELKKITGVNNVEIELQKGLAYISTPKSQKPSKKNIETIITNAGFSVGKIKYSDKPFERNKIEKE